MTTFPRRPGASGGGTRMIGHPSEAPACKCGDQRMVEEDTCIRCGRLPECEIRAEWAKAAEVELVRAA